jgi:hypothetical protein
VYEKKPRSRSLWLRSGQIAAALILSGSGQSPSSHDTVGRTEQVEEVEQPGHVVVVHEVS